MSTPDAELLAAVNALPDAAGVYASWPTFKNKLKTYSASTSLTNLRAARGILLNMRGTISLDVLNPVITRLRELENPGTGSTLVGASAVSDGALAAMAATAAEREAASGGGTPAAINTTGAVPPTAVPGIAGALTAAATGGGGLPTGLFMAPVAAAGSGGLTTDLFTPPVAVSRRRGTPIVASAAAAAPMPLAPAPMPLAPAPMPLAPAPMPLAPAPVAPTTCVPSPEQYSAVVAAANAMQGLVAAMAAARTATAGGAPPRSKWNPKSWVGSGGARKSRKHSGLRNRKTQRRK